MVSSGGAFIVSSGVATTFRGAPLRVTLDPAEAGLALEWVFTDAEEAAIDFEPMDHGMRFRCQGVDDRPVRGSRAPVAIATIGSDTLYVHFRVARIGRDGDWTVQYTVYRVAEGEGSDGGDSDGNVDGDGDGDGDGAHR